MFGAIELGNTQELHSTCVRIRHSGLGVVCFGQNVDCRSHWEFSELGKTAANAVWPPVGEFSSWGDES